MSIKKDLRLLIKPYYLINLFLSLSYIIGKKITWVCLNIFAKKDCELDGKETEILFFLMIVIMIRTRKAGSITMINYLSASFLYTKLTNVILWFYADIRLGILFGILVILCGLLLPEPTYQGPENITYIHGEKGLKDEIQRDTKVTWLIAFYTAWSPPCVTLAPVFAQLSAEYALDNFKFGKIDVGRHPDAAAKYQINDASTSRQLPTLILFQNGKEVERRPYGDSKGKLVKFLFSLDNIKAAFDLNTVYKKCKENPIIKKDKKAKKNE